jgi:hypothetical protein
MSENRIIVLAGQKYSVAPLSLRVNREVYPICRRLSNAGLIDRAVASQGSLDCTPEEMGDLSDLVFLVIAAGGDTIERDKFDDLPITPPELLEAFIQIRYQTGAWLAPTAENQGDAPGEAAGVSAPRRTKRRK